MTNKLLQIYLFYGNIYADADIELCDSVVGEIC